MLDRASGIAFGYAKDCFVRWPLLAALVEEPLASERALANRVTISCLDPALLPRLVHSGADFAEV
jgi:hypothetical protein